MRRSVLIAIVVAAVALVGAGAWWFLLRDDAPAEVDLEDAVRANTTTTAQGATTTAPPAAGIEGTWTVDSASGAVDFESATGSFAGFRVDEELASIGASTAVGRTRQVSGSLTIEGDSLTAADMTVQLTGITTNNSRRDPRVQQALDTGRFPTATFRLTEPVEVPAGAATGEKISTTATGELTVHGVTEPVEVKLEAVLRDGTAFVTGSTVITLADFGVSAPKVGPVLSVSDQATVEWQLLLNRT